MTARRPASVAFDVIGTLFSLEPLRTRLQAAGLPPDALETWYAESLRDAFALAASGNGSYQPFQALLDANLDVLSLRHGSVLGRLRKGGILSALQELPPHPDAAEALAALAAAGIPAIAFSNGGAAATEALLRRAGLRDAVRLVVSTDEAGLSKPRREAYHHAAARAGTPPDRVALVAAHPWDIHGAKLAGLTAGFVARGRAFPTVLAAPDVQGEGLAEVARALAALPAA